MKIFIEILNNYTQNYDAKIGQHPPDNEAEMVAPEHDNIETTTDILNKQIKIQFYIIINALQTHESKPLKHQIQLKYFTFFQHFKNIFIPQDHQNIIFIAFQYSQRIYLALTRFVNIVRHKIAKTRIATDLSMEPINPKSRYSFALVQSGSKYWFTLSDLVNIIEKPITNSSEMFACPSYPKNPYNNIRFTTTELYNIYYAIKFTYLTTPRWIQLFFEAKFCINCFKLNNEMQLREHYIKSFVQDGCIQELYDETIYMLRTFRHLFRGFKISKQFPKKDFVNIFRPYLFLYLFQENFVHGTEKRFNAETILYRKIRQFAEYNKNFGRKHVSLDTVFRVTEPNNNQVVRRFVRNISFDYKHPDFTLNDAYDLINHKKTSNPANEVHTASLRSFREVLSEYSMTTPPRRVVRAQLPVIQREPFEQAQQSMEEGEETDILDLEDNLYREEDDDDGYDE